MGIIFTQTDTAAQDGFLTACGNLGVQVTTPISCQMSEGAAAGSVEATLTVHSSDAPNAIAIAMQSAPGEPNDTSWEAGDYTVRVNVSTGNTDLSFSEVHVCRISSGGTIQETLGSLTGLAEDLTAGVHTFTVAGAAATALSSDELYIAIAVEQTTGHGNMDAGITFDQNVDTPITLIMPAGTGNLSIPVISMSAAGSMLEPEGQAALLLEDAALDAQGEQDAHGVAALDMTLYTTTASKYDGSNDYATRGADLTGNTNSFGVLVSVFVNIDAAGEGTVRTIYGAEGERVHLYLDANDKIVWELWDGSSQLVLLTSTNTYTSADGWFCIMANYRVVSDSDKDSWIYVNDTQEAHDDVFTANGIDCTRTDHAVGAKTTGVDLFAGDLSELFIHFSTTDARVFLTDVKERRKFVNSKGRATPKGNDGSEVLGAIPLVYAPDGDPSDNKGSGGNFAITGALETSVTSPAEGPEAVGLAGSGTHTEGGATGTGDVSLAAVALDADGVLIPEAIGSIALADELLTAQGGQTFEGAGDIIVQQGVLDAVGALQPEATADIGLDESILIAEGSTGEATGSASLVLSEGTLQAEGHEHPKGSATLTLNAASLTASGIETIPGSAVLLLADSELVGTALMQPEGEATIILSDALLVAEGVHGAPQGTGNLLIDQMVLEAQGEQPYEGAANLTVDQVVLEGEGALLPDGTSAIKLERVVLTTQGSGGGSLQVFDWIVHARRRGRR